MNLKKQLQEFQEFINDSSTFDVSPIVIKNAIIPALVKLAKPLKNAYYYVYQDRNSEELLLTILQNRFNPKIEKKVIYAFASFAIAENFVKIDPSQVVIMETATTKLIFNTFGIPSEELDSIIFVRQKGNNLHFQELECKEIKRTIEEKIQNLKPLLENVDSHTRLV